MRLLIVLPLVLLAGCAGSRIAGQKTTPTIGDAVASPLYDINVLRTKIPTVLLDAMDAPYNLPSPLTCREIAAQVRPLDEALGPDLDAPDTDDDPSLLERTMSESHRVSSKYVFAAEYFSPKAETLPYRGETELLFKNDFGGLYMDMFPDLELVDYGFFWRRTTVMDDCTWWLFRKAR